METLPIPCEHDAFALMAGMPDIETVRALESMLLQLPQVNIETQHMLHAGMYARTIFIPAGVMATGANLSLDSVGILFGDITVTTDEGTQRLTGFNVLSASKGHKRAGIANSDTWWTTVFRTDATTVDEAEKSITSESDMLLSRKLLKDTLCLD
jgi:hypothetical protein